MVINFKEAEKVAEKIAGGDVYSIDFIASEAVDEELGFLFCAITGSDKDENDLAAWEICMKPSGENAEGQHTGYTVLWSEDIA
jgi:hypothetical protein